MNNKLKKMVWSDIADVGIIVAAASGVIWGNNSLWINALGLVCCVLGVVSIVVKNRSKKENNTLE